MVGADVGVIVGVVAAGAQDVITRRTTVSQLRPNQTILLFMKDQDMPELTRISSKGQVVIPAQIRKSFKVKAGDKLIVFAKPGGMIGFVPTEEFNQFLNEAAEMVAKFKK